MESTAVAAKQMTITVVTMRTEDAENVFRTHLPTLANQHVIVQPDGMEIHANVKTGTFNFAYFVRCQNHPSIVMMSAWTSTPTACAMVEAHVSAMTRGRLATVMRDTMANIVRMSLKVIKMMKLAKDLHLAF